MADGTVRIDSELDASGFNKGMDELSQSMAKAGKEISRSQRGMSDGFLEVAFAAAKIGVGISKVLSILKKVVVAVAGLTIGAYYLVSGFGKFAEKIGGAGDASEDLKASLDAMKMSVLNVVRPLVTALLPTIIKIADWVSVILNRVAMVVGALMGQKVIMQGVASAAGDVAQGIKDADKAAKGALASFDELNVLQMEEPVDPTGGGAGGAMQFEEIQIDEDILLFFERLKEFVEPLIGPLRELWDAFLGLIDSIGEALQPLWDELGLDWDTLGTDIRDMAINGIEWLTERLIELSEWIDENPELFVDMATNFGILAGGVWLAVAALGAFSGPLLLVILLLIALVALFLLIKTNGENLKTMFKQMGFILKWELGQSIKIIITMWSKVSKWFIEKLWPEIKTTFKDSLVDVERFWKSTFIKILSFTVLIFRAIKQVINSILGSIESGLNGAISAINSINFTVPSWIGGDYGGKSFHPNMPTISIPRLATGAVIPPNASFLALLGDQKSGTNIEAPEELIRQIVREEGGGQEITIKFEGSLGALVRTLKPYIDKENKRVGGSLIAGGNV